MSSEFPPFLRGELGDVQRIPPFSKGGELGDVQRIPPFSKGGQGDFERNPVLKALRGAGPPHSTRPRADGGRRFPV